MLTTKAAANPAHSARSCEILASSVKTATGIAPGRETTGDPSFNAPWSYTGQPTLSFPIGLSPDGLPLSFQLVGRPSDDASLFGVAAWCERGLVL